MNSKSAWHFDTNMKHKIHKIDFFKKNDAMQLYLICIELSQALPSGAMTTAVMETQGGTPTISGLSTGNDIRSYMCRSMI